MAKKKNRSDKKAFDEYDDFFEEDEDFKPKKESKPDPAFSLIMNGKIEAFMRTFDSCTDECVAHELFTDFRLREYFGVYFITGVGDLLPFYISILNNHGYPLTTSISLGVPCVMVRYRSNATENATFSE